MQREQLIQRIKKLLKHAESARKLGSIEEAEAFAFKANQLLIEHNIAQMEVEETEESDKFRNMGWSETISYKDNQAGSAWRIFLLRSIVKYNFCNFTYKQGLKTFQIYGKMENVEVVVWLYNFLSTGLLSLAQHQHTLLSKEQKKAYNRYAFLKDFLLGASQGIDYQFQKQREEQETNKMTSLIIYNNKALQEYIKHSDPEIKTGNPVKKQRVGEAFTKGLSAGKEYKVVKTPLPQQQKAPKLI